MKKLTNILFKKPKKLQKLQCSYCGEAPVSHTLYFLDSFVSSGLETHAVKIIKFVPRFIKNFVDLIPKFLFEVAYFFNVVEFSSDINKAKTFRSKVIWEEAERRGIQMQQVIWNGKPLDFYRVMQNDKYFYFESLPIRPELGEMKKNWDDKIVLKEELKKHNIPIPLYFKLPFWSLKNREEIFSKLTKPIIVKPRLGSRARHTITNINTLEQFEKGVAVAREISAHIIAEEHLDGFICRVTVVGGKLAGFYRGAIPRVIGDGEKTIRKLIEEKNSPRPERYHVRITPELHDHIGRGGFFIDDILPQRVSLSLSHRAGQLFGGNTREMIDELHPSFIPIFERAADVTSLPVAGFDCIIPDPTKDEASQKWGIIECNTLPFIDIHYFALEGKPRNIAGMIWDLGLL